MRRMRGWLVSALVVALISAVGVVPAGAKNKSAAAKIRRSVDVTRDEGTAAIEGSMRIATEDGKVTIGIEGAIDLGASGNGLMTMDFGGALIEARYVDGVIYEDFGPLFDSFDEDPPPELEGRHWVKIDLGLSLEDPEAEASAPAGTTNPSSQLDALRGIVKGSIETIGVETIRGVEATHYRGLVDMETALAGVPEESRAQFEEQFGVSLQESTEQVSDYEVDVWIDAGGRVRREKLRFELTTGGKTAEQTLAFDYVEFGVPVDVQVPPADEVIDFKEFTDLAKSEGSSST
jgi:hypothetical protein